MAKRSKSTATPVSRGGGMEAEDPLRFASTITRIAVLQICQSIGFRRIQTSALQILSDVAARYVCALAEVAASSAASSGRTQSNLYDVVRALEELNSIQGFRGASVQNRDLLASSTAANLASFVSYNDEIPFAKPIRRRPQSVITVVPPPKTVPSQFSHIPMWFPAIPDMGSAAETTTNNERNDRESKSRADDICGGCGGGSGIGSSSDGFGGKKGVNMRMELPVKREKVRFKIGGGSGGLGLSSGVVCKGGKRVSCGNGLIVDDDEDEGVRDKVSLKKMMLMIKKKKKNTCSSSSNSSRSSNGSNSRRTKLIGR